MAMAAAAAHGNGVGNINMMPPPVVVDRVEEAELLGTETDIEDDALNLHRITKTDL
jgi:hypothetical protein